jgi:hypothetical protein
MVSARSFIQVASSIGLSLMMYLPVTASTCQAFGKEEADARVERSLYMRAVGYSYDAEKIFCDKNGKVTRVPYREHVPPDVTAQIFWLKNRDPAHWRERGRLLVG